MLEFLLQLDNELFLFLNGLHASWLDPVMYWVSNKFFWIPFYALLLWFCYKQYGWKLILILVLIAVLITLSDQLTGFMKDYFQRWRPSRDENLDGLVHTVYGYRGGRYGFASSHAANSMALAVFMVHLLKGRIKYIVPAMFTFAFLNGYSRIYLGVHYPGDVVLGALVGLLVALLVIQLWKFLSMKFYPVK